MTTATAQQRFRTEYGAQRAAEGRALNLTSLLQLPYLAVGPVAAQWAVRARTFDALVTRIVAPQARALGRPLRIADLGAGNGWLSWRMALAGHHAVAVDVRDDRVDGLGAAASYLEGGGVWFDRIVGSFEAVPMVSERFDLVIFNAALHYALDLAATMREARRLTHVGGRVAILDSPWYDDAADGEAMVREKHRDATGRFGDRADVLMSLPFIEFLTAARLRLASAPLGIAWTRHRVRYPLRYELRPLVAKVRGRRTPSRFDLWEGVVA